MNNRYIPKTEYENALQIIVDYHIQQRGDAKFMLSPIEWINKLKDQGIIVPSKLQNALTMTGSDCLLLFKYVASATDSRLLSIPGVGRNTIKCFHMLKKYPIV